MNIDFEWDAQNAIDHFKKHKVSFELAARVFADPFMLMVQDRIEKGEQRWQSLGMVEGQVLLLVAHTVAENGRGTELIRIISARKADKQERKRYENYQR